MKRLDAIPLPLSRPADPSRGRRRAAPVGQHEVRPGCRITDDLDLAALWSFLTGAVVPGSRTLWLAMVDEDGRAVPTVFPIADCADEPGRESLENLAGLIEHLVEEGVAATVPTLLARPGLGAMTEQDRRWARALRSTLGPPVSCWSTFLLTGDGLRPFAPDDLISAAARPR